MKKFFRVFVPILLAIVILGGIIWYLFVYDKDFTRDALLTGARYFEGQGRLDTASWFYDRAYEQGSGSDEIAVELARQYAESGNYTQAEVTLNRAIADGGGASVYVALSNTYVQQDKLLDAVELLDKLPDSALKEELNAMRPAAPTTLQTPGFYNQYIRVTVESESSRLYANAAGQYPSVQTDAYAEPITLTDGENVIYALAVSDEGLVSPLSVFSYTVGGVIEEVQFSDPVIEQSVRSLLQVSDSQVLYSNDLWNITDYTVPEGATVYNDLRYMVFLESLTVDSGVSGQLSCLSGMTALKTLQITATPVSAEEMEIIGTLTALEKLTLSSCALSSVSPLSGLTELTYLDLSGNAIGNISALSSMAKLQQLNMQRNALQDVSALSQCALLQSLNISYNSVTTLSGISALPVLGVLNAGHNQIADLSPLVQSAALTELQLNNNALTDISALSNCAKLSYLDISGNTVTDISMLNLSTLTYLNFSNNQVTALPKWDKDCSLVTIDGSYNKLTDLSPLSGLNSLNQVYMDYNEGITSVDTLADCPVLIQVNVYGTGVKDVSKLTGQSVVVNYNPLEN